MRLEIKLYSETKFCIPFNYNHQLQAAIYAIIKTAEPEFATFLHRVGYISNGSIQSTVPLLPPPVGAERANIDSPTTTTPLRTFKFFTFSKLYFPGFKTSQLSANYGFSHLNHATFYFSTNMDKICESFVVGIFKDKTIKLNFPQNKVSLYVENVATLPEPVFTDKMTFKCLSPISVSTMIERDGKLKQHFLDYTNPEETEHFKANIYKNLIRKYEVIYERKWINPPLPLPKGRAESECPKGRAESTFDFTFDQKYIDKNRGKISKLITFKKDEKIKCFEAPFAIETYSELIQIGYETGFGDKNSAGFGCVEVAGI